VRQRRSNRNKSRNHCNRNFGWGSKALSTIVEQLPKYLNAAISLYCISSSHQRSNLPEILTRAGNLAAAHSRDGGPIDCGRIYVAPPDRHLLIEPGQVRITKGPKENRFRPAIDPLFRSAAYSYGLGVVLTGALDYGIQILPKFWLHSLKVRSGRKRDL
jgi:two-component system, chemotaxis family, protein-glutamate methylesterase/glutaminase